MCPKNAFVSFFWTKSSTFGVLSMFGEISGSPAVHHRGDSLQNMIKIKAIHLLKQFTTNNQK
jgi:hypothetical protein